MEKGKRTYSLYRPESTSHASTWICNNARKTSKIFATFRIFLLLHTCPSSQTLKRMGIILPHSIAWLSMGWIPNSVLHIERTPWCIVKQMSIFAWRCFGYAFTIPTSGNILTRYWPQFKLHSSTSSAPCSGSGVTYIMNWIAVIALPCSQM